MARGTNTSNSTRPRAAVEAPKRKPGRPIGSTGTKKATPASAAKPVKSSATRGAIARPAARAAKPNRAELEIQLGKLERTVVRLREKNKELKQIATEAREHADTLEAQLAAKPVAAAPKPPRKNRRPARQPDPEIVTDDPDLDEGEGSAPQG